MLFNSAQGGMAPARQRRGGAGRTAISRTGHTNRGRVRQKSHKSAELLETGELRCAPRALGSQTLDHTLAGKRRAAVRARRPCGWH